MAHYVGRILRRIFIYGNVLTTFQTRYVHMLKIRKRKGLTDGANFIRNYLLKLCYSPFYLFFLIAKQQTSHKGACINAKSSFKRANISTMSFKQARGFMLLQLHESAVIARQSCVLCYVCMCGYQWNI